MLPERCAEDAQPIPTDADDSQMARLGPVAQSQGLGELINVRRACFNSLFQIAGGELELIN